MNLKHWLRRQPQPARLMLDGTAVPISNGARRWQEAADTIDAMGGTKLQALAADGSVLRATTLESDDDDDDAKAKDKLQSDLQYLSSLVATAWKEGAAVGRQSADGSFEKLVQVVQLMAERLTSIETAWQQQLINTADLYQQLCDARAEGGDDAVLEMLGPMFARDRGKKKKLVEAKPTNGAAKA